MYDTIDGRKIKDGDDYRRYVEERSLALRLKTLPFTMHIEKPARAPYQGKPLASRPMVGTK